MKERLHIVMDGEWLTSIAHDYGFPAGDEIYRYEKNEAFRELRPDPTVIYAGDEIWIPPCPYETELDLKQDGGKAYKITAARPAKEKLELELHDDEGEPLANLPYTLTIGGYSIEGTTDGDGKLSEEFDTHLLNFGSYKLVVDGKEIPLEIGHLDPITTTKGLQGRLNNLGYDCGPVDGAAGPQTRKATRLFQEDNGLTPDGVAGPKTRDKLKSVYGG